MGNSASTVQKSDLTSYVTNDQLTQQLANQNKLNSTYATQQEVQNSSSNLYTTVQSEAMWCTGGGICSTPLANQSVNMSNIYMTPGYSDTVTPWGNTNNPNNAQIANDKGRGLMLVGNKPAGGTTRIVSAYDQLNVRGNLNVDNNIISGQNAQIGKIFLTNGYTGASGTVGQAEISCDNGTFKALMLVGNSAGGGRLVQVWDNLYVNGNTVHNGSISAPSAIINGRDIVKNLDQIATKLGIKYNS